MNIQNTLDLIAFVSFIDTIISKYNYWIVYEYQKHFFIL